MDVKKQAQTVVETVKKLAEPFLEADGYELVEVQYRRESQDWILRLFVDRAPSGQSSGIEGGITLDDCVAISRELGHLLDVEEAVPGAYHLEISSPGLDRPLKKPADFVRFTGREVQVRVKDPIDGRRKFKGKLAGINGDTITLSTDGGTIDLRLTAIDRAALEPEIDWGRA